MSDVQTETTVETNIPATEKPKVGNIAITIYALAPAITMAMEQTAGKDMPGAFFFILCIFIFVDASGLKKSGIQNRPSIWLGLFLPPVYFYKRSKALTQGHWLLAIWILGILSLLNSL